MSAAAASTASNQPGAKQSLVGKIKIPGIILAIVALEWVMASFFMPSSDPAPPSVPVAALEAAESVEAAEDHADKPAAEEHAPAHDEKADHHEKADKGHGGGHGDAHGEAKAAPKHSDAEEVDLGNYTVSGFQPASNSTLFITFHLFGTVKHKYVDEFNQRVSENQHRIRDNVIVIIRSAEITDLTDAGLGLIKRRILETTNRTLGKPLLQEVVFSDFSFIEQ